MSERKPGTGPMDPVVQTIIDSWGKHIWAQLKANDAIGGTEIILLKDLYYDEPYNVVFADILRRYPRGIDPKYECTIKHNQRATHYLCIERLTTAQILERLIGRNGKQWFTIILRVLQTASRELYLRTDGPEGLPFLQPYTLRNQFKIVEATGFDNL